MPLSPTELPLPFPPLVSSISPRRSLQSRLPCLSLSWRSRGHQATMATFLPRQPDPPQPHQEFLPNLPDMSYMSNLPPQSSSAHASDDPATHHGSPAANALPAYPPSANGSMPVPPVPPPHVAAGGPRHRSATSMGALPFDAARSPPNTKSKPLPRSARWDSNRLVARHLSCTLQILQAGPMSSRQSLPIFTLHRHL